MKVLKYKDLNEEQKKHICNGCGSKGGIVKIPNFIFKASCNHHDFKYWLGCNKEDRKKADKAFYSKMKEDIKDVKWYLKAHYHIWAFTYYNSVRLGGKKAFCYRDNHKTLMDLNEEIADAKTLLMFEALKKDKEELET